MIKSIWDEYANALLPKYYEEKEEEKKPEEKTALRISDTEPIMFGSAIGKTVWRCKRCYNRIDSQDAYCRTCGARFVEREVPRPEGGPNK